ncbi:MAG: hypothetical protein JSV86_12865 [Gemmatimonadota bacterium]|nr:MAG: hypothetical protein JSV86_12865 [Gemmatimonadota bacterium]
MTGVEGGIVGVAVFLALGAFKLLERVIDKRNGTNGKGLSSEERTWLAELHQWHDRHDQDGVPLWYLPRRLLESQREIVQEIRRLNQVMQSCGTSMKEIAARRCPMRGDEEK